MRIALLALFIVAASPAAQPPKKLVDAQDGSGVFGYKHTPVQPWSGYHVHDPDTPKPPKVKPSARPGGPPSDAVVLFDGASLAQFEPTQWKLENGYIEATEGLLASKQKFGDCQIHVEWRTPDPPEGEIMNRGNNGVLLMGLFEIQIFDSYTVKIYPDGQAASLYGQAPPKVDAALPPGAWQTFDIVFLAPRWKEGKLDRPARVTVLHNGVLVHHNQEIYGAVAHAILPKPYPPGVETGPLVFGGHHNPVRFRNIWARPVAEAVRLK
jgi:hypothetical protein